MLEVEPQEYYPLIHKLFVSEIVEAVDTLGASVRRIRAKVREGKRVLFLTFDVDVVRYSLSGVVDTETIVQGILEKRIQEANSSFGKLYGFRFVLESVTITEDVPRREKREDARLVVSGPQEMEDALRRLGRGLMITLKEWNVPLTSITVTTDDLISPETVSIVLKLAEQMGKAEKDSLKSSVETKARSYAKALLPERLNIQVKVLDPSDKNIAQVMKRAKSIEKEIEELTKNEDLKKLMEALGKSL